MIEIYYTYGCALYEGMFVTCYGTQIVIVVNNNEGILWIIVDRTSKNWGRF